MKYYAHSLEGQPPERWQLLEDHLKNVAEIAAKFAARFEARGWGHCAGRLHDAGKATGAFRERLDGKPIKVDHATFGARLAQGRGGKLGVLLAYVIAGHHGGLPDGGEQESQLHHRLKHRQIPEDVELLPEADVGCDLSLPFKLTRDLDRAGFTLTFFSRMVYSCLVDADFLDTEFFCNSQKAKERLRHTEVTFVELRQRLDSYLEEVARTAKPTPVNVLRREVLDQCRKKAELPKQFFSLTVPTGGGKTLSSMVFALGHAVRQGLSRVIYAIPFTSIIEQNAKVFQDILGREVVLEHHCNFKAGDEPEEAPYHLRRGLAAENWDTPIVVTTNVQFFESLFSNKPSRCRKLHNIAGSVIVLDEAQAIPTEYLEPCLAALRELVERYGCSVVLCTATQPALDDKSKLRMALPAIEEIIDRPGGLFEKLTRTEIQFVGCLSDAELAGRLEAERQVLCIVSTKPQVRTIFERLARKEGVFHLSTNMYPEHRRQVLSEVRQRLKNQQVCRLVSTSLVEAGVDLDFPVVYRAMAGLDSIAQAAGRCNREGKLPNQLGQVYVFETEQMPRLPWLKRCISRAEETRRTLPEAAPLGLEVMRRYFELLYDAENPDRKKIMKLLALQGSDLSFPFAEVAGEFKLIEEDTIGVVVPIESEAEALVRELRFAEFPRSTMRKLQSYSVTLRMKEYRELLAAGAVFVLRDEFPVLLNLAAYRQDVGLCVDLANVWNEELFLQ